MSIARNIISNEGFNVGLSLPFELRLEDFRMVRLYDPRSSR